MVMRSSCLSSQVIKHPASRKPQQTVFVPLQTQNGRLALCGCPKPSDNTCPR
ncbi:hypothetical protein SERLADRAFT_460211 [Serpula lacrymans var. lacrymans S7.9]|uniref:Uncharacterized protein n=1 Tax=Serpula lacrymans var. lacrymans (strain S7.9) TaxID=578457 RepID=F8NPJ6_SERL9|nr:uncharacterized protein SERLADRAFT_460211 [Serpula lacrymans var. lacrymans S7.9]EGO27206.1 hypothetical protein SERLADRAFT_460211 [Serpula lacrymans var. lacrymans S7.9]